MKSGYEYHLWSWREKAVFNVQLFCLAFGLWFIVLPFYVMPKVAYQYLVKERRGE